MRLQGYTTKPEIFEVIERFIFNDMSIWIDGNDQSTIEIEWDRLTKMFDLTIINSNNPEDVGDWILMQAISEFMAEMRYGFLSANKETRKQFMGAWREGLERANTHYRKFLHDAEEKGVFDMEMLHDIVLIWIEPAVEIFK